MTQEPPPAPRRRAWPRPTATAPRRMLLLVLALLLLALLLERRHDVAAGVAQHAEAGVAALARGLRAAPPVLAPAQARSTPPPPAPRSAPALPPVPGWPTLLAQADAGDPRSACELSTLLEDCRLLDDVALMIDTQISVAAVGGDDVARAAREIAQLERSSDALRARCSSVPPELVARGWHYLLRAAIAGHEGSMLRFVVDPPLDAVEAGERASARRAHREQAPLLLTQLLQRGAPDALALAFRAAQGERFTVSLLRPQADAVVRYGAALLVLREDDSISLDGLATARTQLPGSQAVRAEHEGRRDALRFLQRERLAEATADGCEHGWPGDARRLAGYPY